MYRMSLKARRVQWAEHVVRMPNSNPAINGVDSMFANKMDRIPGNVVVRYSMNYRQTALNRVLLEIHCDVSVVLKVKIRIN